MEINKQAIEKRFDEKFGTTLRDVDGYHMDEEVLLFIFNEILPEVLKSVCIYDDKVFKNYVDGVCQSDALVHHLMATEKEKAKELYNIDL